MGIEGQGHFFTIYFPGFVCFVLYLAKISGERLQDHWSSGFKKLILKKISRRQKSLKNYPVCNELGGVMQLKTEIEKDVTAFTSEAFVKKANFTERRRLLRNDLQSLHFSLHLLVA